MSNEELAIGDRFTMTEKAEPYELKEEDRILARFLPGFTYSVTDKNIATAQMLVRRGEAIKGGLSLEERAKNAGINLGAVRGDVKARVVVGVTRGKRNLKKET